MKFKIYYINLARSFDKNDFMEDQLQNLGFDYERIDAIDGQVLDMSKVKDFAVPGRIAEWKHLLTPNAIACSMSHHKAYTKINQDKVDVALILEDDILLLPDFRNIIQKAIININNQDIFLVYFHGEKKKFINQDSIYLSENYRFYRTKTTWGAYAAGGYLLHKDVAKKLEEHVFPVHTTADSWGTFKRDGIIGNLWSLLPLTTTDAPFLSDIGYGKYPRIKQWIRWISKRRYLPFAKIFFYYRNHVKPISHDYEIVDEAPDEI